MKNGLIYVFTGDGKGKTSAALGVAVRAICSNMKVGWIFWYKNASWPISELNLPRFMPIDFFLLGKGFYIKEAKYQGQSAGKTAPLKGGGLVTDSVSVGEHKDSASKALAKLKELLDEGKYNLVVCDEICNALSDGLLMWEEVKKVIEKKEKTHLILTGRNANTELIEQADLVTSMQKVKHPYDLGNKAVKGLDF
jgi:cob(I)alamin adenosyltransferase